MYIFCLKTQWYWLLPRVRYSVKVTCICPRKLNESIWLTSLWYLLYRSGLEPNLQYSQGLPVFNYACELWGARETWKSSKWRVVSFLVHSVSSRLPLLIYCFELLDLFHKSSAFWEKMNPSSSWTKAISASQAVTTKLFSGLGTGWIQKTRAGGFGEEVPLLL